MNQKYQLESPTVPSTARSYAPVIRGAVAVGIGQANRIANGRLSPRNRLFIGLSEILVNELLRRNSRPWVRDIGQGIRAAGSVQIVKAVYDVWA